MRKQWLTFRGHGRVKEEAVVLPIISDLPNMIHDLLVVGNRKQ